MEIVYAEVVSTSSTKSSSGSLSTLSAFRTRRRQTGIVQAHAVPTTHSSGGATSNKKKSKSSKRKQQQQQQQKQKHYDQRSVTSTSRRLRFVTIIACMAMFVVLGCWVSIFLTQNPLNARGARRNNRDSNNKLSRPTNSSNRGNKNVPQKGRRMRRTCSARNKNGITKPQQTKDELKQEIMERLEREGEFKMQLSDGTYGIVSSVDRSGMASPQPKFNTNEEPRLQQCKAGAL